MTASLTMETKSENTPPNIKTNEIIGIVIDMEEYHKGHLDLTGRFPYRSGQRNQYILVAFFVDANAILVQAIKNRESQSAINT